MNRRSVLAAAAGALALAALSSCMMSDRGSPLAPLSERNVFEDTPAFEPAEFSGEGDGVVELPEGVTQAIVTASHDGERYFSIASLDEGNEPTGDMLVTETGAYSGVTLLGAYNQGEPARLEITADGAWTIALTPISEAPAFAESGTGDAVFRYDGDAATWAVTHSGEHTFQLSYYTDADLPLSILAAELGAYDGDIAVTDGPALVVVKADGDWTITSK